MAVMIGSGGRMTAATLGTAVPAHASGSEGVRASERSRPHYFRTYPQITARMRQLATQYPHLVQMREIGRSEAGGGVASRPIYALTLTASGKPSVASDGSDRSAPQEGPARKPVALYVAGVHAREIANPALLMTFVEQLVRRYGTDAFATSLLDSRQIDIVPVLNPSGYAKIERGYAGQAGGDLNQRKNARGVDINRNFDYEWGAPGGSSSDPIDGDYRGPAVASESETRALQTLIDQRRPDLFIDWHSYGMLNLYPWGHTSQPAPDAENLRAVSRRFSQLNRHTTKVSADLYTTSGTTDDYAYGRYGIPAFCVETALSFHAVPYDYEFMARRNLRVLRYATRIADAPYERAKGPDAQKIRISRAGTPDGIGSHRGLVARVSDVGAGSQAIAAAEWVTDPLTRPGSGQPATAVDGAFDGATELVRAQLPDTLEARQLVYVRARDADGNWGPLRASWAGA